MTMIWHGLQEFQLRMDEVIGGSSQVARDIVIEAGYRLQHTAMDKASGRPGPEVISGTLRRGVKVEPVVPTGPGSWGTTVGPTVLYSRRVELGFFGTDSSGRSYAQPGYPFFVPAYEELLREFPIVVAEMTERYFRRWL